MNRDAIAFALVLAGALCAECIPLAAVLIGAAWVVKFAYRRCPYCGAYLDPGERCDCQDEKELPGATNTEQPKETQHSSNTITKSALIVSGAGKGSQV